MVPNENGWLWSQQLDSGLVPEGAYLRLYDRYHQQRLTEEEAQRAEEAAERVQRLAEKLQSLGVNPDDLM